LVILGNLFLYNRKGTHKCSAELIHKTTWC